MQAYTQKGLASIAGQPLGEERCTVASLASLPSTVKGASSLLHVNTLHCNNKGFCNCRTYRLYPYGFDFLYLWVLIRCRQSQKKRLTVRSLFPFFPPFRYWLQLPLQWIQMSGSLPTRSSAPDLGCSDVCACLSVCLVCSAPTVSLRRSY